MSCSLLDLEAIDPVLFELLGNTSPRVRWLAADALASRATHVDHTRIAGAIEKEKSDLVGCALSRALPRVDLRDADALRRVERLLDALQGSVRRCAMVAMFTADPEPLLDIFIQLSGAGGDLEDRRLASRLLARAPAGAKTRVCDAWRALRDIPELASEAARQRVAFRCPSADALPSATVDEDLPKPQQARQLRLTRGSTFIVGDSSTKRPPRGRLLFEEFAPLDARSSQGSALAELFSTPFPSACSFAKR